MTHDEFASRSVLSIVPMTRGARLCTDFILCIERIDSSAHVTCSFCQPGLLRSGMCEVSCDILRYPVQLAPHLMRFNKCLLSSSHAAVLACSSRRRAVAIGARYPGRRLSLHVDVIVDIKDSRRIDVVHRVLGTSQIIPSARLVQLRAHHLLLRSEHPQHFLFLG